MRHALIGLLMTAATIVATPADASVNVSIGINVPTYPSLVRVPNYPVYYAPSLQANYFFYDGLYWVYGQDGIWYESPSWAVGTALRMARRTRSSTMRTSAGFDARYSFTDPKRFVVTMKSSLTLAFVCETSLPPFLRKPGEMNSTSFAEFQSVVSSSD